MALRARSSSVRDSSQNKPEISEESSSVKIVKFQPFIKEEVLSYLCGVSVFIVILIFQNLATLLYLLFYFFSQDTFPCTAEEYFKFLLDDGSTFTDEYRAFRKDTNLQVSAERLILIFVFWHGIKSV